MLPTSEVNLYLIIHFLFVGYGVVVPRSNTGKIFTMFYAVPGISLAVATYSYAACALIGITKCLLILLEINLLKRTRIRYFKIKVLICQIFMALSTLFIEAAFHTFKELENYGYLDAVYFTFITLTTIGFGDFNYDFRKHIEKPYFFLIVATIFLLGLGLVASVVTSVVEILLSTEQNELNMLPESDDVVENTKL